VLLDLRMPVLDGRGFAQAARERGLQVPLIAMTAERDVRAWAREIEAAGHLAKPFDAEVLVRMVASLAGGPLAGEPIRDDSEVLRGVRLAAEAMEHHMNGRLAEIVARVEMVQQDPRCPAELQEDLGRVIRAALACSETLRRLTRTRRVRRDDHFPGLDLLELA
jgi:response regulator RpfG family c-di-GMP phosphodiesterase